MENQNSIDAPGLAAFAGNLQELNPSYSRYSMYRAKEISSDKVLKPHCKMCYTILTSDNHKVRLAPRMPLTKNMKKLLDRYASPSSSSTPLSSASQSLSKFQKKMVKKYLSSSNTLVISCSVCGKNTKIKCQGRASRVKQRLSWSAPPDTDEKVQNPKVKKKKKPKKSKKSSTSTLTLDSPVVLSKQQTSKKEQPITEKHGRSKGAVGSPLITSTPVPSNDSGIEECPKQSHVPKCGKQNSVKPSPVFALLGSSGSPADGGVKKKKNKGKHKHLHLEKLLHEQKLTDSKSKSGKKNSLAAFLSELTY